MRSSSAFPVFVQRMPANGVEPSRDDIGQHSIEITDLRWLKETIFHRNTLAFCETNSK